MRRTIAQALLVVGTITIFIGLLNYLVTLFFPTGITQKIVLLVGISVVVFGALSGLKDTVELLHLISGKQSTVNVKSTTLTPFLSQFISVYMNTRIIEVTGGKTYRLFGNQLFLTVNQLYSSWLSFSIGSPGQKNLKIEQAKVGDSFIYKNQLKYEVRVAQYILGIGYKLIITRLDSQNSNRHSKKLSNASST